jgi:hypothetical protein
VLLSGVPDSPPRERDVASDIRALRLIVQPGLIGLVVGAAVGALAAGNWLAGAVVGAVALPVIATAIYALAAGAASGVISNATMPGYRGAPAAGYSHIEALEAKGDVTGALTAWETVIRDAPDAIAARVHAADLYAGKGSNPSRAATLFRVVQAHPTAPSEVQRYASQRLVDLYLGPLNDQGRALVELRKIADRWAGTPEADGARRAIAQIKGS